MTIYYPPPFTPSAWGEDYLAACHNGDLDTLQSLLHPIHRHAFDLPTYHHGLIPACGRGHLHLVTFLTTSPLLSTLGLPFVNIHAKNDQGFCYALNQGHLPILDFLSSSPALIAAGHSLVDTRPYFTVGSNLHRSFIDCSLRHPSAVRYFMDMHSSYRLHRSQPSNPSSSKLSYHEIRAFYQTAFMVALQLGHLEILQLLLTYPYFSPKRPLFSLFHPPCPLPSLLTIQPFKDVPFMMQRKTQCLITLIESHLLPRTPRVFQAALSFPGVSEYFSAQAQHQSLQSALQATLSTSPPNSTSSSLPPSSSSSSLRL